MDDPWILWFVDLFGTFYFGFVDKTEPFEAWGCLCSTAKREEREGDRLRKESHGSLIQLLIQFASICTASWLLWTLLSQLLFFVRWNTARAREVRPVAISWLRCFGNQDVSAKQCYSIEWSQLYTFTIFHHVLPYTKLTKLWTTLSEMGFELHSTVLLPDTEASRNADEGPRNED